MLKQASGLGKSKEVLKVVFGIISEELALGNDVKISKFGTFHIKVREPRMGYNLQTCKVIELPEKRKATFRPASALKELIEENK